MSRTLKAFHIGAAICAYLTFAGVIIVLCVSP